MRIEHQKKSKDLQRQKRLNNHYNAILDNSKRQRLSKDNINILSHYVGFSARARIIDLLMETTLVFDGTKMSNFDIQSLTKISKTTVYTTTEILEYEGIFVVEVDKTYDKVGPKRLRYKLNMNNKLVKAHMTTLKGFIDEGTEFEPVVKETIEKVDDTKIPILAYKDMSDDELIEEIMSLAVHDDDGLVLWEKEEDKIPRIPVDSAICTRFNAIMDIWKDRHGHWSMAWYYDDRESVDTYRPKLVKGAAPDPVSVDYPDGVTLDELEEQLGIGKHAPSKHAPPVAVESELLSEGTDTEGIMAIEDKELKEASESLVGKPLTLDKVQTSEVQQGAGEAPAGPADVDKVIDENVDDEELRAKLREITGG